MRRSSGLFALIVALVLAVAGCGGTSSATAQTSSGSGKIHRGGVLRFLCSSGPSTSMDPPESKNQPDCDTVAFGLLYDTLVREDGSGNFHPDLATRWTLNSAGTVYTFDLRHDVKFSDGSQLNAAAVKFSLDRDKDLPLSPLATALDPITSITTVGDWTVKLGLQQPSSAILPALASPSIGVVSPAAVQRYGQSFELHGGGSGPFVLQSWTPGGSAVFVRNKHYWKKGADGKPLPYLNEVITSAQTTSSVGVLDMKAGDADIYDGIAPTDIPSVQADANLKLVASAGVAPYLVAMNVSRAPFNNVMLRRAVQAALDRSAILQDVGSGVAYLAPMPIAKQAPYYVSKPSPEFNLNTAKKDVSAAGYPNGISLNLDVIDRTPDTQMAQIMQSQLAKIGIKVNIEVLERTTFSSIFTNHTFDFGLFRDAAGPLTPAPWTVLNFDPGSEANYAAYTSPEMSSLMTQLNADRTNAQQKATMEEITALVVKDAPYVTLGNFPGFGVWQKTVHGIDPRVGNVSGAWLSAT